MATTTTRKLVLTDTDRQRLLELSKSLRSVGGPFKHYAAELEAETANARICERAKIGADVITMNSEVCVLNLDTDEEDRFTIVYPHESDILEGRMSVISPLGMALLGRKIGDVVKIEVPTGKQKFRVDKIVYQPEAAGDEHL